MSERSHNKISQSHTYVNGFTLIEMIVVIFILTLVTTLTILNFRSGERRKSVQLAVDNVVNGLRLAQNYTLAGRAIPNNATKSYDSSAACPVVSKAPVDYRVTFNVSTPTQYTLYATDKCQDVWLIETFTLPQRTRVLTNGSGLQFGGTNYSSLQFRFTTPFARLDAAGTDSLSNAAFIDFDHGQVAVEADDASFSLPVQIDAISGRIGQ
jgi:prepilin-type N-terminal cleavage/methylation domain-containing protein